MYNDIIVGSKKINSLTIKNLIINIIRQFMFILGIINVMCDVRYLYDRRQAIIDIIIQISQIYNITN